MVNTFLWVAPLKGDTSKVYCTICKKAFTTDGSGKSKVSFHHKSHSLKDGKNIKKKPAIDPSQEVFQPALDGKISMSDHALDHAEQVCRAEIYQALYVAHSNYSFFQIFQLP